MSAGPPGENVEHPWGHVQGPRQPPSDATCGESRGPWIGDTQSIAFNDLSLWKLKRGGIPFYLNF